MTSTRFVMRLMIGSIGDRTVSPAFRIEKSAVESAESCGPVALRRSWLKRISRWAARSARNLYRAADTIMRAFGPQVADSKWSSQTKRPTITGVCRPALLEHRATEVCVANKPSGEEILSRKAFIACTRPARGVNHLKLLDSATKRGR